MPLILHGRARCAQETRTTRLDMRRRYDKKKSIEIHGRICAGVRGKTEMMAELVDVMYTCAYHILLTWALDISSLWPTGSYRTEVALGVCVADHVCYHVFLLHLASFASYFLISDPS